ncbi:MAG: hypothetical protein J6T97_02670 [Bacteroidaceae bacterium]|nr:hypothetical protein [Bacteroidaceae bacterium]
MSKDNIIQVEGKPLCLLYRALCTGILFVLSTLFFPSNAQNQNLTGISGNVVTIDDREDHNWTYYSDKPDADYPDNLRSPDPRNVKITYRGGSVNNASAVAVSATESQDEIVYYKTIEKKAWGTDEGRWLTGDYAYKVIPNPFSKRPRTNNTTGTNGFYGFAGWKIISGGEYINGHNDGQTLDLEEKINFVNLPAGNDGNGAVVFEATWTAANVVTVDANVTRAAGLAGTGGTYETNFIVVSGNDRTVTGMTRNATVMGCYPDGTGATGARLSTVTGSGNDLKIENINLGTGGSDFTANTGWLIVGRGCTGNVRRVIGNTGQIKMRIESGTYNFVHPMHNNGTNSHNNANYGLIIFGNDYDRATNDGLTSNDQYADNSTHRKLRVINYVSFNGTGADKASNDNRDEWMDITIKSGYFGYSSDFSLYSTTNANNADGFGLGIGGNTDHAGTYTAPDINGTNRTYTNLNAGVNNTTYRWQRLMSFYCGRTRGGNYGGVNRVLVEGGELGSINGGGYRNTGANFDVCYHFRMKGGWVKGAIYGTASSSMTNATTKQVITGGEINGWVAGACNGTDVENDDGRNLGDTYIYLGGNAELRSHRKNGVYNNAWGLVGGVEGGSIFASGRGTPATSAQPTRNYCGSSYKTYAVVADNSQVEQNVCGGGYIGVAQNSHIYITGGEIGNVYGGSMTPTSTNNTWMTQNTDIRQYGGTVKGGIYGGHYQGTGNAGKIHQNVKVNIVNGQVGTDADNPGYVHGGGYGSGTSVNGNVDVTIGDATATENLVIYGDVYGGSALGTVNDATSDHTYVTLNAGTIYGSLYGGGLGDLASLGAGHSNVAANVYGPVAVKVYGGSVVKTDDNPGGVFGANNLNGAPQSSVTVDIYSTDAAPGEDSYAINAVYGGGNMADYINNSYPTVTVHNGGTDNSIGYVYGGGNAARVRQTQVKVYGGNKIGNVFGGGNGTDGPAPVTYNSNVDIYGGTILNVFGGSNADGLIGGNVVINVNEQAETGYDLSSAIITNVYGGGNMADVSGSVSVNMTKGKVTGDLYGGGALANTNIGNATNYGAANESITSTATYTTTVNLKGGTVGNAYGGGLGDADHAALVYGDVSVLLDGTAFTVRYEGEDDNRKAVSGRLFGCNNVNGTPKGTVTVTVEKTVGEGGSPKPDKGTNTYELAAVYGGGNEAEYLPISLANAKPVVIINGCDDTSIEYVYGGGNAASVPATDVTVNGCYEIGWVFGGGNGKDKLANGASNPGANVGYHAYTIDGYTDEQAAAIKTAAEYGSGKTAVKLYGGTIHNAFGGSNTKGNVKELAEVTLDHPEDDSNQCALVVDDVFGAGNEAPMDGSANIILGCVDYLSEIYGGANQADLNSDVVLTIQSGSFGRVFGGNNVSGVINGTITVNIEETGCKPIIIGQLYGGGNKAPYEAPMGTNGERRPGPTVNVKSFTSIGEVYGGGLGVEATVTGDTYVNINEAIITTDEEHSTKAYTGQTIEYSDGTEVTLPIRPASQDGSMGVIGAVYGGGNAAKVIGNTNVNIATLETVYFESLTTDKTKQVEGANITGNIYGGGNQAEVTGKPTVTIGRQQP